MPAVRYVVLAFLAFLACAPVLAFGQVPDSVNVIEIEQGTTCPAYGADFGVPIRDTVGPDSLGDAQPFDACTPLTNPEDVRGTATFVKSGGCSYVTKVQHASAAGASSVVVYNDDPQHPDSLVWMRGDCPPEVCNVPAASVSYECGLAILAPEYFPKIITIVPIRITPPISTEPTVSESSLTLAAIHPNPTASGATVRLDLPTAQAVRVAVFDVLGRRVAVLHDGPLGASAHRLRLDAAALPAGVYVVRAVAGDKRITRKLVVAR